jgi:hypothetical protein
MPTGYTAPVADGTVTDLRTFALQCARGMGALIMMRDSSADAPIPERFEPNDFNAKRLEEARAERQRLYAMTEAEADAEATAEYRQKLAAKEKWQAESVERRNRYQAMIAKVVPWQRAPDGLKEFMLDQLHRGMEFDCPERETYWDEPELLTGAEWRRRKLAGAEKDILYNAEEDAKERARTEGRNAWIAQLRSALASVDRSGLQAGETQSEAARLDPEDESAVPAEERADAQIPPSKDSPHVPV